MICDDDIDDSAFQPATRAASAPSEGPTETSADQPEPGSDGSGPTSEENDVEGGAI